MRCDHFLRVQSFLEEVGRGSCGVVSTLERTIKSIKVYPCFDQIRFLREKGYIQDRSCPDSAGDVATSRLKREPRPSPPRSCKGRPPMLSMARRCVAAKEAKVSSSSLHGQRGYSVTKEGNEARRVAATVLYFVRNIVSSGTTSCLF